MKMQSSRILFRFILIRLCLVALGVRVIAALCCVTWLDLYAQPPAPTSPPALVPVQSPKAKAVAALIVVPPPRIFTNVMLSWNYPSSAMPIRFEVQHHTTAYYAFRNTVDTNAAPEHWIMWAIPESGWSLLAYTTNKCFITPIRPIRSHLFRVRAEDTATGLVSEWASK